MTANDQLYVQFKPTGSDEVAFIDLLIRMTGVHIKARHVLQKEDYRTIMETVFMVISYCLSSLDHERSGYPQPEAGERAQQERAEALAFCGASAPASSRTWTTSSTGGRSAPTSTACSELSSCWAWLVSCSPPPRPKWELRQLQIPPRRRAGGEHRSDHQRHVADHLWPVLAQQRDHRLPARQESLGHPGHPGSGPALHRHHLWDRHLCA